MCVLFFLQKRILIQIIESLIEIMINVINQSKILKKFIEAHDLKQIFRYGLKRNYEI